MKLKRLNEPGMRRFIRFLDSLTTSEPEPYPQDLLSEMAFTDPLSDIEIEPKIFANRLEASEYLYEKLEALEGVQVERDKGLWAWLALYYFEQLCKRGPKGEYQPKARERWILEPGDYRRYYRHLLAGPYLVYRTHRDNPSRAWSLFYGPVHTPGEILGQLASRQELITSAAVIEMVTKLYIDPATRRPKVGAASKGGGGARRLAEILNQFDLTWDFFIMESDDILEMLPKEFDKFRKSTE